MVNLNASLGPFHALNINTMKVAWFNNWLLPAYDNNLEELRRDLQNLDAEMCGVDLNPTPNNNWAWTWHVPWWSIKVVIVGNQPTNDVTSSGLAFHPLDGNEVSETTRLIFRQVAAEFQQRKPNDNGNFSLHGWTSQGVVLVNSMITKDRNGKAHEAWLPIMRKMLKYIYYKRPNVQFIIVGSEVRQHLVEHQNNLPLYDSRIQFAIHPTYHTQQAGKNLANCLRNCPADVKWAALDMWSGVDANNN